MSVPANDPDILAWRAELAVMSFEGAFGQIKNLCRFCELEEYELAIRALERAMPFWASAIEEMRVIRDAVRSDRLTVEAAIEHREQRAKGVKSRLATATPSTQRRIENAEA